MIATFFSAEKATRGAPVAPQPARINQASVRADARRRRARALAQRARPHSGVDAHHDRDGLCSFLHPTRASAAQMAKCKN